jgi:hypothetical protein
MLGVTYTNYKITKLKVANWGTTKTSLQSFSKWPLAFFVFKDIQIIGDT